MIFPHGYGEIPNVISLTDKLTDTERRVWCYHYIRGMQHGKAMAEPKTVAKDLNLKSEEVVRRVNRALKAFGLMVIEPDENGITVYRLLDIPTSFSELDEVIQLPRNKRREERQAAKQERQEERPAQPANQPKPARQDKPKANEAVEIFHQVTGFYPSSQKAPGLREEIEKTVRNIPTWRQFLENCLERKVWVQRVEIVQEYKDWVAKKREAAAADLPGGNRHARNWLASHEYPLRRMRLDVVVIYNEIVAEWKKLPAEQQIYESFDRLQAQLVSKHKREREERVSSGTAAEKQNPGATNTGVLSANHSQ